MKKDKEYLLIDTTDVPEYSDYVEYCKANNIEPDEEDSVDYWEYVGDMQRYYYEEELINIKHSDDMDKPCIITGSLGLWNGRKTVWATYSKDIVSAIKKCFGSCDDLVVTFKNGVYNCKAMHHDGTNYFEIRKLTNSGIKAVEKWYSESNSVEVKPSWVGKFKGY